MLLLNKNKLEVQSRTQRTIIISVKYSIDTYTRVSPPIRDPPPLNYYNLASSPPSQFPSYPKPPHTFKQIPKLSFHNSNNNNHPRAHKKNHPPPQPPPARIENRTNQPRKPTQLISDKPPAAVKHSRRGNESPRESGGRRGWPSQISASGRAFRGTGGRGAARTRS